MTAARGSPSGCACAGALPRVTITRHDHHRHSSPIRPSRGGEHPAPEAIRAGQADRGGPAGVRAHRLREAGLQREPARAVTASPSNPTGTSVARAELERFLDRVPERAVVVMDEAYFEYADSPDYPDSWEYARQGRSVIVLRTFSKIYGLAGLRVGYGMARPEL